VIPSAVGSPRFLSHPYVTGLQRVRNLVVNVLGGFSPLAVMVSARAKVLSSKELCVKHMNHSSGAEAAFFGSVKSMMLVYSRFFRLPPLSTISPVCILL